ncbi:MAG TPA: SDR family oxidoreductase [Acidimicrobiia bacterium]|nr:SDR family oxidoreductase [Acidimicrobiia bacterium]
MDFGIAGKVALVSGGTQGIGFAAAQALLNEGAHVAIFSRSRDNVNQALANLDAGTSKVSGFSCDLLDETSVEEMLAKVRAELGSIDIFVGSSGGPSFGKAHELSHDDLITALESNFVGLATLTNKLLPDMQKNNWGRIVYVTTSGVIQPVPNLALSNVSRSALTSFTKTLSTEVASQGITVNTVIPGRIDTPRLQEATRNEAKTHDMTYEEKLAQDWKAIPTGRYGEPEEIANAISFLCSEGASYITGIRIAVDGGLIKSV